MNRLKESLLVRSDLFQEQAEGYLTEYHALKASIPNLESQEHLYRRRARRKDAGEPFDRTMANTLKRQIRDTRELIQQIEAVLEQMKEEGGDRVEKEAGQVLYYIYINKLTIDEIKELMHYSSSQTIYDRKHVGLEKFTIRMFGVGGMR